MASYQYDGACYQSTEALVQAAAASFVGTTFVAGGQTYYISGAFGSVSAAGIGVKYFYSNLQSGVYASRTQYMDPPSCQLLDTADGLIVGWGIALAWIATFAVVTLRKGLHT